MRCSDSEDDEDIKSSEDVEPWLLQCDRSQCANEMESAVAAEAGSCPRAAVMFFRQWCNTEEITGVLELMSAWVAEPGLPSLPPEVSAVAKLIVGPVPRSHMDEWAIGNVRAVEREMTSKRRRVEAGSARRRLLDDFLTAPLSQWESGALFHLPQW